MFENRKKPPTTNLEFKYKIFKKYYYCYQCESAQLGLCYEWTLQKKRC